MKTIKFDLVDGLKSGHRKEGAIERDNYQLVVFDAKRKSSYHDGFFAAVDLRLYYSKGETVYACVWVNDGVKGMHGSGSGIARGYNYHKGSAAAANAFEACGIEFDEEISGRGESSIEDGLRAIAARLKYKNFTVIKTHA